jgi:septum formation protein
MSTPTLVLASASARRRDLLTQLGVAFLVDPAAIDEARRPGEEASDYVLRMAREKAALVAQRHQPERHRVLGADTTVVIDGDVLGKPVDHFDGLAMLARLSGRRHEVITAVALGTPAGLDTRVVVTEVEFVTLGRAQCEAYLATDEPWDKAGGYAIQGLAGAFVSTINGSYSNVVGLPLCETWQLLSAHGIATGLSGPPGSADE